MRNWASQQGPQSRNTIFSVGFCKFRCAISTPNMAPFRMSWGVGNAFFEDIACLQLSKSGFPQRAGSILSKSWAKNAIRRGVKAQKYKKKADDAQTNGKFQVYCRQAFLQKRPWRRKVHGTAGKSNILKGDRSRKMRNRSGQRAISAKKGSQRVVILGLEGSKKWIFEGKMLRAVF